MDENRLENIYQENLEERIMLHLKETEDITYEKSVRIYYTSKLSKKIEEGKNGIQYLDYKIFVEILKETEPELFNQ